MSLPLPPVIAPDELAQVLQAHPEVRLLDVRTPGEYETAHIRGAYNVPLDHLGEHGDEIRASVNDPVVLICQSGQRAKKAEAALAAAGMPNVHVLAGGVSGWMSAGKPVVRGKVRMSLERQVRIVAGALAATGGLLALAINPMFAILPAFVGSGLVFAGVSDTCTMGMALARLPYNRPASCDVAVMMRALTSGSPPAGHRSAPGVPAGGTACC